MTGRLQFERGRVKITVAVVTRHAAIYVGHLAVERVPAGVDGDFFRSLSRM
jgi:hypothetical protein